VLSCIFMTTSSLEQHDHCSSPLGALGTRFGQQVSAAGCLLCRSPVGSNAALGFELQAARMPPVPLVTTYASGRSVGAGRRQSVRFLTNVLTNDSNITYRKI
jgi:hypothetical protein